MIIFVIDLQHGCSPDRRVLVTTLRVNLIYLQTENYHAFLVVIDWRLFFDVTLRFVYSSSYSACSTIEYTLYAASL